MKIFYFLLIFISCKIYSQNLEKIKQADTLYIFFKKQKDNQIALLQKKDLFNYYFRFVTKDGYYDYSFFQDINNPRIESKNKTFLKKNKDLILTHEFLKKFNDVIWREIFLEKKKIYIIDHSDFKWFCIKLRDAKFNASNPVIIE